MCVLGGGGVRRSRRCSLRVLGCTATRTFFQFDDGDAIGSVAAGVHLIRVDASSSSIEETVTVEMAYFLRQGDRFLPIELKVGR